MMLRLRDDEGVALITALLVSFVVTILAMSSMAISVHNLDQSLGHRERVQSAASGEAGLNVVFSHLQNASPDTIACQISQSLTASPPTSFVADLYIDDGLGGFAPLSCPPPTMPSQILVHSTGTAIGDTPARTFESLVDLVPIAGGLFGPEAVFSDGPLTFDANVAVESVSGDGGNVYTNSDLDLRNNSVVTGDAHAQGTMTIGSKAEVKGSAWSNGALTMSSQSIVREDVTSSTSSVTLQGNSRVFGDAKAGTTIGTSGSSTIDGLQVPNTPSGPPPMRPFPTYTYQSTEWQSAGYSVHTATSCALAKAFIAAIVSGDWVVRITDTCSLTWPSNTTVNVKGDLAIVHDGPMTLESNMRFTAVGGPHELYLMAGLGAGACNLDVRSNASIGSGLSTLVYSPCSVVFNSNSFVLDGQVYGGNVSFTSNTTINHVVMEGPGGQTVGYDVEPRYVREIKN